MHFLEAADVPSRQLSALLKLLFLGLEFHYGVKILLEVSRGLLCDAVFLDQLVEPRDLRLSQASSRLRSSFSRDIASWRHILRSLILLSKSCIRCLLLILNYFLLDFCILFVRLRLPAPRSRSSLLNDLDLRRKLQILDFSVLKVVGSGPLVLQHSV